MQEKSLTAKKGSLAKASVPLRNTANIDNLLANGTILEIRPVLRNPDITMDQFTNALTKIFENFIRFSYGHDIQNPYLLLSFLKKDLFEDIKQNPNPILNINGTKFLEDYLRQNWTY